MTTSLRTVVLTLLALAGSSCVSQPQIKEGPHRGWSESLAIDEAVREGAKEDEYQNALQRFD